MPGNAALFDSAPSMLSAPAVLSILRRLPAAGRYWVAFSGGPDSHALVHVLSGLRQRLAGGEIRAVHVNHRLLAEADVWQAHCERICHALGIPLVATAAHIRARVGGPEASAREARYRALAGVMEGGDVLMTGHTLDDQAETVLLQLMRGAGPAGLAGMPECARFAAGWLARPLLGFAREEVHEYARRNQLVFVRDPSNEDRRLDRGFVRAEILPRLRERWPGLLGVMERVARHQADARALLNDLAASDLAALRGEAEGALSCAGLRSLSAQRQRNAIRAWLETGGHPCPSAAQLERIRRELLGARPDGAPRVAWPGAEVRRYRDDVIAMCPLEKVSAPERAEWRVGEPKVFAHGELRAFEALGAGIAARKLRGARVECRFRAGGERCRPAGRRHGQSLKKLLQEHRIPPWLRERVPLVYVDGGLAAVGELWVCHGFAAADGERGWVLRWRDFAFDPAFD